MFGVRFVVCWVAALVAVGYVQSALPVSQLGRASSKGKAECCIKLFHLVCSFEAP